MRKLILVACALMAGMTLFAQDIIVTKEAKKIDAKILEVSTSEIRYQELDNLDGPTFVLRTDEIVTIIYANGKVVLFNDAPQEPVSTYDLDAVEGNTYLSEDGEIKFKYDFTNKRVYIQSKTPLMVHSKEVRNIAILSFHFDGTDQYLIFDMSNKVEGVALLSGSRAFSHNEKFHKFFKKNMPTSFTIDVPYETRHGSYTIRLAN